MTIPEAEEMLKKELAHIERMIELHGVNSPKDVAFLGVQAPAHRIRPRQMSRLRYIEHDEYAAWEGVCGCRHCQPVPADPDDQDHDERDDAREWHGVD